MTQGPVFTDLMHDAVEALLPGHTTGIGLDPSALDELEACWRAQSGVVGEIDLTGLCPPSGPSSRVVEALRASREPAAAALTSISGRLLAMSVALGCFTTTSVAADEHAARIFGFMTER